MISSKCRIFSEVSENRAGYAATVWEPIEGVEGAEGAVYFEAEDRRERLGEGGVSEDDRLMSDFLPPPSLDGYTLLILFFLLHSHCL